MSTASSPLSVPVCFDDNPRKPENCRLECRAAYTSPSTPYSGQALVAVAMGMITPTFGSLMRDTLLQKEPVLLGPEIYVSAALASSLSYVLILHAGVANPNALCIAVLIAFSLRAAALIWDIRLPRYGA